MRKILPQAQFLFLILTCLPVECIFQQKQDLGNTIKLKMETATQLLEIGELEKFKIRTTTLYHSILLPKLKHLVRELDYKTLPSTLSKRYKRGNIRTHEKQT